MAKEVFKKIRLTIAAGKASPAPPIGPCLSQFQINIAEFCKQFNDKTKDMNGILTPVDLTIYKDKSFTFILKTPPTSELIRRAINIQRGSATPNLKKVGKITKDQLRKIVETKLVDLNTTDPEVAMKIVEGTARQMGVTVI